uniref:Protein YIF1 n=1 Tax=Meloidogyne javanica TaxID=6303 RepID=A0A915LST9_MELJA
MTTPHYYDQNKNLNSPNPFDSQQQHLFDGQQQQANFDYYTQQQPQYDPHFNYSSNIPPPDTSQQQQSFNQQFMYDPFVNTARHLGGQFAEQQKQKITQYISTFNLKYYFAVDVNYVRPPDLYIPSMAFITYILVAGIVFGVQQRFTPEKLGMLTTNALFYMIFENLIVFLMKYALNISQSLNLRSLKTFILDMGWSPNSGRKRKIYLLLAITAFQSLIMWLLTSSVTSYMPGKYDFAKMAMSGMGLSNTNKEVPLMSDGEVDYEALLKMP